MRTKRVMDLFKTYNKAYGKMWSKNPILAFNFKSEVTRIDNLIKQ